MSKRMNGVSEKLTLFVASVLMCAQCAGQTAPPADQMVDIGTHRLQVRVRGNGTPTIVLDAGLADRLEKMGTLQERLARTTCVVSYNRAGYGRSEPGPAPRDCGREARELKNLLENSSLPAPYVLVGHSLGALNVQAFASMYPDDVAGMVLLDPPPLPFILGERYDTLRAMADRMTGQWEVIADSTARSNDPGQKAQSAFFHMIASEHRSMFGESSRFVGAIKSFGDLPLVVIASGKPNPGFGALAGEFQKFWIEQSDSLARMSSRGSFILAKSASHNLYVDAPDLVAKEILSVVHECRTKEEQKAK